MTSAGSITIGRRSAGGDILMSPTKLTPENSSLLRNVSPVKRIDFDNKPTLQIRSKSEKLSRFKRTVIASNGQKIISRFFSSGCSSSSVSNHQTSCTDPSESPTVKKEEVNDEREATSIYLLSPEAKLQNRGEQTPKKQNPNKLSHEDGLCSPDPPAKGERSVEKIDVGFVDEPETEFSSSQKENEAVEGKSSRLQLFEKKTTARAGESSTNEINDEGGEAGVWKIEDESSSSGDVIEIKEESGLIRTQESLGSLSQRSLTGKNSQKNTCKRVGLTRSKKLKDPGVTQCKLSMFGFQRK